MTRKFEFEQVDVFTREKFRGNPLAVFTDAVGLTKAQMQDVAKEMNLSETTFVIPSERADCVARVYIFTPGMEMPFAGHPTVGTTWVLARQGRFPTGASSARLHENVGPVSVRIEGAVEDPSAIFLTAPPVAFGDVFENKAEMASALNVQGTDLLPNVPVQMVGAPVPFLYVALRARTQVDEVSLNTPALMQLIQGHDAVGIFVFAPDGANRAYSRMLGLEHAGVVEDPATGAASGPLGAYLVRYGIASGGKRIDILSEQGTKMGRQSFVSIIVERAGEEIQRIEVGGSVVPVLRGWLEI